MIKKAKDDLRGTWPDDLSLKNLKNLDRRNLAIWTKVMHAIYRHNIGGTPLTWFSVKGSFTEFKLTQKLVAEKNDKMLDFLRIWKEP